MRNIILIFTVLPLLSWAAIRPTTLKPATSALEVAQRQIGGVAGSGFTLLNVQRIQSPNGKIERLVFEIGTKEGQPLKGLPGYFNVQNQTKPGRIVMDFSQMFSTKIDEKFMRAILKDSKMVRGLHMTSDPLDQTLSLTLNLKGPVQMKTLQVPGKNTTAKVLLDIIKK